MYQVQLNSRRCQVWWYGTYIIVVREQSGGARTTARSEGRATERLSGRRWTIDEGSPSSRQIAERTDDRPSERPTARSTGSNDVRDVLLFVV